MITPASEPAHARDLLHENLRHAGGQGADAANWEVGYPLPVWRFALRMGKCDQLLHGARRIGWRYPLRRTDDKAVALLLARGKSFAFAGISRQSFAERLFTAADLATRDLAPSTIAYQPRLLEMPGLRMIVLWLLARGGKSRFVVLKLPYDRGEADLVIEDDIEPHLLNAIAYTVARPRGEQASPAGT